MSGIGRAFFMGPQIVGPFTSSLSASSGMLVDAAGEKLAWKIYPSTTSPIVGADVNLVVVGPPTTNWKLAAFADAANAPDEATPLGSPTPEFTVAGTGFVGLKTLAADTGALTLNIPLWLVMYISSGAAPDGTHSIQARELATRPNQEVLRHYNGADWTTTAARSLAGAIVCRHANGTYTGYPFTSAATGLGTALGAPKIYDTNRHGVVFRVGAKTTMRGVQFNVLKNSTPGDLVIAFYRGAVEIGSQTLPAAQVQHSARTVAWLTTPLPLVPSTDYYIVLRQAGSNASQNYELSGNPIVEAYVESILPSYWRAVYGPGNDPTAYTVSGAFAPYLGPVIDDSVVDLIGGGSYGSVG